MKDKIFKKLREVLPDIEKNIPLKNYTTFKIGGPARYFFITKTKDDLLKAVKTVKKIKLPIFILGGGSNLLVSDKGFNGLVIKLQVTSYKLQNSKVYVGAGVALNVFADFCANNGLAGMEWAAGIPGATVGGSIYGHAQAFGEKISDAIESVQALDTKALKIKRLTKEQCKFSLKNSVFKKNKNLIIISAVFALKKGDNKKIQEKVKEFMDYRKNRHPMSFPSAGSIFINPEKGGKIIRAGYLIEKAGLKGKRTGNAQFSDQHANFIINLGGAKAGDVLSLIKLVQKEVKKTFGIKLETEVQFLGFTPTP